VLLLLEKCKPRHCKGVTFLHWYHQAHHQFTRVWKQNELVKAVFLLTPKGVYACCYTSVLLLLHHAETVAFEELPAIKSIHEKAVFKHRSCWSEEKSCMSVSLFHLSSAATYHPTSAHQGWTTKILLCTRNGTQYYLCSGKAFLWVSEDFGFLWRTGAMQILCLGCSRNMYCSCESAELAAEFREN